MLWPALTVVVLWFTGSYLWRQWQSASRSDLHVTGDVPALVLASLIVLATYALLIETWRRVLACYGQPISFVDAAHVWFVSNLGKYVPGKIWQITAMTAMVGRLGVRLADAGSASLVITLANVVAGFALVLGAGTAVFRAVGGVWANAAMVGTVVLLALLAAAPWAVKLLATAATRLLKRPIALAVPASAAWISLAGCTVAWLLYGVAFRLLVRALIGHADGPWTSYLAVYTVSYLIGYLAVFAPGGIGARELSMSPALVTLHLASGPEAVVITIASRLWLTVLEIVPGLLFLPRRVKPGADESRTGQGTSPTPP